MGKDLLGCGWINWTEDTSQKYLPVSPDFKMATLEIIKGSVKIFLKPGSFLVPDTGFILQNLIGKLCCCYVVVINQDKRKILKKLKFI